MNIRRLQPDDLPELAAILVEAVAHGASISFMAGFDTAAALAFWADKAAAMARGDLVVLVADDSGHVAGTVTLVLAMPPNQPHRADVSKMIVGRTWQRQGLGAALMAAVEAEAARHGRTTLVLDTISGSAAARLYHRCGWTLVGEIPDYALMPEGGLAPTSVYFKRLPPAL